MPVDDVAPLVGAAHLQLDVVVLAEVPEVVGLEQHVAELGVGDPVLALHAVPDRVLGHHLVDGHVLADVTEEVEHSDRGGPVGVVDQGGLQWPGLEVQQALELHLDGRDVVVERVPVEQVALLAATAGVADHPGGTAGQRERSVTGQLQPAQRELPEQVPDVEAVGGRVEADVDADRSLGQPGGEGLPVGRVLHEAAGLQLGEEVHSGIMVPRRSRTGRATCHDRSLGPENGALSRTARSRTTRRRRSRGGTTTRSRTHRCRTTGRRGTGSDDPPWPAPSG